MIAALKADAPANVKSDQGRKAWFCLSGLQFFKLNFGEWTACVLQALMVGGLIAVVGGFSVTALVVASVDFLMLFGFAAMNYGITRSSSHEKPVKRFRIIAALTLIIVHFVIQMAS